MTRVPGNWLLAAVLLVLWSPACHDTKSAKQARDRGYSVPLLGRPLPGHTLGRRGFKRPEVSVRPMTRAELLDVAYRFHPARQGQDPVKIVQPPQHPGLRTAIEASYTRLENWLSLITAIDDTLGGRQRGFFVMNQTAWKSSFSYAIYIHRAKRDPGDSHRELVVQMSYLVPYYTYREIHSRTVDEKRFDSELPTYEISPEMAPVLALVESEIRRRYGYFRLDRDLAMTLVPGMIIGGREAVPATLRDALFGDWTGGGP